MSTAAVDLRVLVLNRSFLPIQITSVKKAFCMVYREVAKFVDHEYNTFDFESWAQLSVAKEEESIHTVGQLIRVPRVILLQTYDRLPKKRVRFSRYNIFLRDKSTCQYCGSQFPKGELNLDHVIPRSQNGRTTWENIVCSCLSCNRRKGGRTPEQASMELIRKPVRPHWTECLNLSPKSRDFKVWKPFLTMVDFSYWNVELQE